MTKLLEEPFIQKKVINYLSENKGFNKPVKPTGLREKGVDIKMKHKNYGSYYLVECKGDPKEKVKNPNGWRSSAMNSAMGQIITRMHTERKAPYGGYSYGIAFPCSFKNKVLKKIPYYVCKKLKLTIFLVNQKGVVEEYNYTKLKTIQNKKL
jgi:hypothetical protein